MDSNGNVNADMIHTYVQVLDKDKFIEEGRFDAESDPAVV